MQVNIDFETRSTIDLRRAGVYVYAAHLTTDIWCMAWAIDESEPELWKLGDPFPALLLDAIHAGAELCAWNAQFERIIWNAVGRRYGWPATAREQWYDTAADAAAMALPRALGQCADVLGVSEQKLDLGHNFVLRMSRPRSVKGGEVVWWTDPKRLARLYTYCKQDVRTERAIRKATRRLGARERATYLLDQKMNDHGVRLDTKLAHAMKYISEQGVQEANAKLFAVTGVVTGVTKVIDLRAWLGTQGIDVDGVPKDVVRDLLADPNLPPDVRTALTIRQEAGRSSVAKIFSALGARGADGFIRGLLVYHGANTGRWAGRYVQPQNFPRGDFDYRPFLQLVMDRDYDTLNTVAPPLAVISAMLRGLFIASEGQRLLVGDFAQIEARVLAWLAGQDDLVQQFVKGEKIYEPMAALIYDVPAEDVTKEDPRRKIGKDTILGCGFGMGPSKFCTQILKKEGIVVSEELAERAVRLYRLAFPRIPQLWRRMNSAALRAVANPGTTEIVERCKFTRRGAYLWIILPSGRPLAYAAPKIEPRETPWGEVRDCVLAWSVDAETKQWKRRALYGGLLTENIVQALARDIMVDAMHRLDAHGYPLVFTVHDEIIVDIPNGQGSLDEFTALAKVVPTWAHGCPVDFESWEGHRYRK
jgi:DNA polymerase